MVLVVGRDAMQCSRLKKLSLAAEQSLRAATTRLFCLYDDVVVSQQQATTYTTAGARLDTSPVYTIAYCILYATQ